MERNNNFVCFFKRGVALFLGVFILLNMPACTMEATNIPYDTPREWTPVYNSHQHEGFCSIADLSAFQERLTEEDLAKILPDKPLPFKVDKAIVKFKEDRTVYEVVLCIGSRESNTTVVIGDGARHNFCCSFLKKGENKSPCGNLEYTLYQVGDDLMAETDIMGANMVARTFGRMSKQDFEAILECFSWYSIGKPKIYTIRPREH